MRITRKSIIIAAGFGDGSKIARTVRPDVPFIFLSGTIGEELAIESLKEGATDYVIKDRMTRLPIAIRRALCRNSVFRAS